MADFLALMGDAVDNIPGVHGVGRKTAAQLLKHFDALPGAFEILDAVPKLKVRGAACPGPLDVGCVLRRAGFRSHAAGPGPPHPRHGALRPETRASCGRRGVPASRCQLDGAYAGPDGDSAACW
jgi:hypothetical protein